MAVCEAGALRRADVIRFDHGQKTFALYRDEEGRHYATDGVCTHGNTHLSEGLIFGNTIECAKHNGRFNLVDGSPARAPDLPRAGHLSGGGAGRADSREHSQSRRGGRAGRRRPSSSA